MMNQEQIASNILRSGLSDQRVINLLDNLKLKSFNARFMCDTLLSLVPSVPVLQFFILRLADINFTNIYGETALFNFANRDIELFRFALEIGADLNIRSSGGETILSHLIKTGNIEAFKLLIERDDLDLNECGREVSPLVTAVLYNRFEMVDILVRKGADTNNVEQLVSKSIEIFNRNGYKTPRKPKSVSRFCAMAEFLSECIKETRNERLAKIIRSELSR